MRMPYIKFYVRDWMMSVDLRRCSYAARGLWIEMLCLMSMDRYGYLEHNGEAIKEAELESLTMGISERDKGGVNPLLEELEQHGVFSRDENGCIYSRRMVQDEEKRRMFEEYGKEGGNPKLKKRIQKEDKKEPRTQNPEPTLGLTQGVNPLRPSPEEVEAYGKSIEYAISGQVFCDFYESRGWYYKAGVRVKDWRAAVRTWKHRDAKPSSPTRPASPYTALKLLSELRQQREILLNRYGREENRRISLPPDKQTVADTLAHRIKEVEAELRGGR